MKKLLTITFVCISSLSFSAEPCVKVVSWKHNNIAFEKDGVIYYATIKGFEKIEDKDKTEDKN